MMRSTSLPICLSLQQIKHQIMLKKQNFHRSALETINHKAKHGKTLHSTPKCMLTFGSPERMFFSSGRQFIGDDSYVPPVPQYNWHYLLSDKNTSAIAENITIRRGVGDIETLIDLWKKYRNMLGLDDNICLRTLQSEMLFPELNIEEVIRLKRELFLAASSIPNHTHPSTPVGEEHASRQIDLVGSKREFGFTPKGILQLGTDLKCLRTHHVGVTTGSRSYYFAGDFAKLQDALVDYTLKHLAEQGFQFIYVPEMIHPSVIQGCGFKTSGERHQVYHLYPSNQKEVCLVGTGEMPLAGLAANQVLSHHHLPQKLMTVSRCYRAEVSEGKQEKGIYRVHQFNKVEMFALTKAEDSDSVYREFQSIQKQLFSRLGLHFRILDMPSTELGAPAYCKFDMETWMPDVGFWGEISSTSNCTDYQSRRLNIQYTDENGGLNFVHTVNGTACAVPRLIMAIAENNQNEDGSIEIPEVLQSYMGKSVIEKPRKYHKLLPLVFTHSGH